MKSDGVSGFFLRVLLLYTCLLVEQPLVMASASNQRRRFSSGGSSSANLPTAPAVATATARHNNSTVPENWRKFAEDRFLVPVRLKLQESIRNNFNKRYFEIKVALEKNNIRIFRDSILIYDKTGKMVFGEPTLGGVHFLVLHPLLGKVMSEKHFKTSQPGESKALSKAIIRVLPGRLLILVTLPFGLYFLTEETQSLLHQIGARRIHRVANNETWAMIWNTGQYDSQGEKPIEGSPIWYEGITLTAHDRKGAPPSQISVNIRKSPLPKCSWERLPWKRPLREFCHTYDGYPELCRCDSPLDPKEVRYSAPKVRLSERIPVALLTAFNSWNFYRQVLNLLSIAGASETPIVVFIDGYHKEIFSIASLFDLPVYVHQPQGWNGSYTRLNMHFRFSVYNIFNLNPKAKKAIILEDDLLLSPDFLLYFQQTSWLLDADPTIYCINSFSINSYPTVASDPTKLRRSSAFPQFGWLISREWATTQLPWWVHEQANKTDWDWWLGMPKVKKGRDVIVPEISRTFHAGSAGSHVTGWEQAFYYDLMIFNQDPNVKLANTKRMVKAVYDKELERELNSTTLLDGDFNPCVEDFPPEKYRGSSTSFRIIVKAFSGLRHDLISFTLMASCFHAHSKDFRDVYEGVQQYTVKNHRIFIVGCPLSPFCKNLLNSNIVVETSEEALELAEDMDLSWRAKNYSIMYNIRWKSSNHVEEYEMRNLFPINKRITGYEMDWD